MAFLCHLKLQTDKLIIESDERWTTRWSSTIVQMSKIVFIPKHVHLEMQTLIRKHNHSHDLSEPNEKWNHLSEQRRFFPDCYCPRYLAQLCRTSSLSCCSDDLFLFIYFFQSAIFVFRKLHCTFLCSGICGLKEHQRDLFGDAVQSVSPPFRQLQVQQML